LKYKQLRREAEDKRLRRAYNLRQEALKRILITCFGYLGYRNARFGKVDAHIAVCAFAREALLKTAKEFMKRIPSALKRLGYYDTKMKNNLTEFSN